MRNARRRWPRLTKDFRVPSRLRPFAEATARGAAAGCRCCMRLRCALLAALDVVSEHELLGMRLQVNLTFQVLDLEAANVMAH